MTFQSLQNARKHVTDIACRRMLKVQYIFIAIEPEPHDRVFQLRFGIQNDIPTNGNGIECRHLRRDYIDLFSFAWPIRELSHFPAFKFTYVTGRNVGRP